MLSYCSIYVQFDTIDLDCWLESRASSGSYSRGIFQSTNFNMYNKLTINKIDNI